MNILHKISTVVSVTIGAISITTGILLMIIGISAIFFPEDSSCPPLCNHITLVGKQSNGEYISQCCAWLGEDKFYCEPLEDFCDTGKCISSLDASY